MTAANYLLYILDASGDTAAVLDTTVVQSLHYERVLNDVGVCQFTLPLDHPAAAHARGKDTLFEVHRYAGGIDYLEGTFLTRFAQEFLDDDGTARGQGHIPADGSHRQELQRRLLH